MQEEDKAQIDGYYGDNDFETDEINLDFLNDEDEAQDSTPKTQG